MSRGGFPSPLHKIRLLDGKRSRDVEPSYGHRLVVIGKGGIQNLSGIGGHVNESPNDEATELNLLGDADLLGPVLWIWKGKGDWDLGARR